MWITVPDKLSKREKVLIYILICLIIVVTAVWLLILPSVSRNIELKDNLDIIRTQKTEMEIRSKSLDKNLSKAEELENKCSELYNGLFDLNTTKEEIDDYITNIAISFGVVPGSLTIESVENSGLPNYNAGIRGSADDNSNYKVYRLEIGGSCSYVAFAEMVNTYETLPQVFVSQATCTSQIGSDNTFYLSLEIYLVSPRED